MLATRQFRYGGDNLGYLVYGSAKGIAIDGGAADELLAFVAERGISLLYVANTHAHSDHTSGNEALLSGSKASLLAPRDLADGRLIELDQDEIRVIHTPGHTADSLCFYTGHALIAGDTLFNGTIGNCFSGDLAGFFNSVKKVMALPDETVVYAGHDYVRDSLAFAKRLEPENRAIDEFLQHYDPRHVFSTLAQERQINPYFRFNEPGIVGLLGRLNLPRATEWERWQSLMSIE